jgi:hypothetical protein
MVRATQERNPGGHRRGCRGASEKRESVYFTDGAGCLRVMMPGGHERRLTDAEIEALAQQPIAKFS